MALCRNDLPTGHTTERSIPTPPKQKGRDEEGHHGTASSRTGSAATISGEKPPNAPSTSTSLAPRR